MSASASQRFPNSSLLGVMIMSKLLGTLRCLLTFRCLLALLCLGEGSKEPDCVCVDTFFFLSIYTQRPYKALKKTPKHEMVMEGRKTRNKDDFDRIPCEN